MCEACVCDIFEAVVVCACECEACVHAMCEECDMCEACLPACLRVCAPMSSQRQFLDHGSGMKAKLQYWKEALAGAPPLLDLPTDRPRPIR